MPEILQNKVALITGGTSGIGEATVELFVAEGAKVMFTGRDGEKGRAVEARLGGNARFFRADVLHEAEVEASVAETVAHFGRLDILFNNAGGLTRGGIEDVTMDDFRHAMDLLVGSVVFGTKHAVPHMKAQGWGRIINNSSVAAIRTHMGGYLYSAAKAAVSQLTRMAGMELGHHGITANAILPGAVATPVFYGGSERARTLDEAENQRKMEKLNRNLAAANPTGRAGQPGDVAQVALFLASEGAGYVNCQEIAADGGMTAGGRDRF